MAAAAAAGLPEQEPEYKQSLEAFYRMAKYSLVVQSDCTADVKTEVVDICVTAVERHPADAEKSTQMIKEALDKRFGGPWHVVVGRAFAFEISHECKHFVHMYVAGTTGVLCWKS